MEEEYLNHNRNENTLHRYAHTQSSQLNSTETILLCGYNKQNFSFAV